MLKFQITNKTYKVNENKQYVVCIIEGQYILDVIPDVTFLYEDIKTDPLFYRISRTKFRGIAECNKNDTFDLLTGQRIAETKAYLKMHANSAKIAKEITRRFLRKAEKYNDLLKKFNNVMREELVNYIKLGKIDVSGLDLYIKEYMKDNK